LLKCSCCRSAEGLNLARTRRQSRFRGMSGMTPTPDLRTRMSGIMLISSGLPPHLRTWQGQATRVRS
jgi:hypothetical protein